MSSRSEHRGPGGDGEAFRLLFVCTGNTCRSPMAEVLAREEVRRRGWSQVEVRSAGVAAAPHQPASPEAVRVVEEAGLDLSPHRSTPVSEEEVERADLVLAMSPSHLRHLEELGAGDRSALITAFAAGREDEEAAGAGVTDPIGQDEAAYRETLEELRRLVARTLDRMEPVLAP